MSDTIPVELHLVVRPDQAAYGTIPKAADSAGPAILAAGEQLWFGEPATTPGKGTWTKAVARVAADGPIDNLALVHAAEDVLAEFQTAQNQALPDDAVALQLASETESGLYYYRDFPEQWCVHEWQVLAAPQGAVDPPTPWLRDVRVTYTDLSGASVEKQLPVAFAVVARFDVDWL